MDFKEPDYDLSLTYDMTIEELGAEGTDLYNNFTSNVIHELSMNSGIPEEDIEFIGVDIGSIVLKFKIT